MSKESRKEGPRVDQERPKIYVTPVGGLYVKADELLRSKRGREMVDAMARLDFKRKSSARPAKDDQ